MKRFQFRLQVALDHRRRLEDRLRAELSQVQQRCREETRRLADMVASQEEAVARAAGALKGPLAPDETRSRQRYLVRLEDEIAQQRGLLQMVEREVSLKLSAVMAAAQETQALERLRDRHLEEHRSDARREEQAHLDELASIRATRSGAGVPQPAAMEEAR